MEIKSVIVGIAIAGIVVAGFVGVTTAIDKLNGIDTSDVTVERINETHAVVSWTTEEKPTRGSIRIAASREVNGKCGRAWGETFKIFKDSSKSRTHLMIVPLYDIDLPHSNYTAVPGNGSLKWYEVRAVSMSDGETVFNDFQRHNLSQACSQQ